MKTRKGITPVIAVVLLLMITVALIGFAFIWFQGVWEDVSEGVGDKIADDINKWDQTIKIDNVKDADTDAGSTVDNTSIVYIRSTGNAEVLVSSMSVYNDDVPIDCYWSVGGTGKLAPKGLIECKSFSAIVSEDVIKVTAPGNNDVTVVG
ncbi:hypothetical protein CL614_03840 [archaeon]|nr:hypothetical protein [archaeon]